MLSLRAWWSVRAALVAPPATPTKDCTRHIWVGENFRWQKKTSIHPDCNDKNNVDFWSEVKNININLWCHSFQFLVCLTLKIPETHVISVKKAGKYGANISTNMAMSFRISAKSLKKKEKSLKKTHQTGQTPWNTLLLHHAHLHFLASESSFVLEMKTKASSVGHFAKHFFAIFLNNIFTLSSTQRGFFHTCQFHLQDKNHTSHTPLATLVQLVLRLSVGGSPFNNHVIVAAAIVASWFPTPTPLRVAWVAKVPDRELEKAWKKRQQESVSIWWVTVSKLVHLTWTVSQNW